MFPPQVHVGRSPLNILAITIISTNLTTCSFNTPQKTTFNNSHQPNLSVTNGYWC
ncbi:hypothetical protein [Spiroplasma endosymbiont of Virgichneumon dumeticola]|uniref:hypothetical protein n=1 Tax=Spiroplasma endosymbiont of Virgichneumon dumeticola TaxID=3139323 RepID=UPI0035C8FDEF